MKWIFILHSRVQRNLSEIYTVDEGNDKIKREQKATIKGRTGYFPWNHSERKYKSLCCHYRFGIF